MEDKSIVIDGFTVQYGKTTVQELVNIGYSISDFEQIIEEPTLACCNLNKDNAVVAMLSFWDIKERISQEQLYDMPIDLVLLEERPRSKYERRKWGTSRRIFFSCLVHVIAAAFFAFCFSDSERLEWLRNLRWGWHGHCYTLVPILLVLPAIMIALLWGCGDVMGKKGNLSKKIMLSLGVILNVGISLAYVLLINNHFTHILF